MFHRHLRNLAKPSRARQWMAGILGVLAVVFFASPGFAQGSGDEALAPVQVIKAKPLIFEAPPAKAEASPSNTINPDAKPAPEPTGYGPAVTPSAERVLPSQTFSPQDRVSVQASAGLFADDSAARVAPRGFAGTPDSGDTYRNSSPMTSRATYTADDLLSDDASVAIDRGVTDQGVIVHRYQAPSPSSNRVTWFDGNRVRTARTFYVDNQPQANDNPHAYTAGGYSRHGLQPTRFTGRGQTPVIIIRDRDHHHGRQACSHGHYSSCNHGCHGHRHDTDRFCSHHRRFCPSSCSFIRSYSAIGFSHHPRIYTYGVSYGHSHFSTTRYIPHAVHYQPVVCQPVYRRPVSGTRIGVSIGF